VPGTHGPSPNSGGEHEADEGLLGHAERLAGIVWRSGPAGRRIGRQPIVDHERVARRRIARAWLGTGTRRRPRQQQPAVRRPPARSRVRSRARARTCGRARGACGRRAPSVTEVLLCTSRAPARRRGGRDGALGDGGAATPRDAGGVNSARRSTASQGRRCQTSAQRARAASRPADRHRAAPRARRYRSGIEVDYEARRGGPAYRPAEGGRRGRSAPDRRPAIRRSDGQRASAAAARHKVGMQQVAEQLEAVHEPRAGREKYADASTVTTSRGRAPRARRDGPQPLQPPARRRSRTASPRTT